MKLLFSGRCCGKKIICLIYRIHVATWDKMPGCVIVGCSNSSVKKLEMCCFPRNHNIRAEWIKQIGKKDWSQLVIQQYIRYF